MRHFVQYLKRFSMGGRFSFQIAIIHCSGDAAQDNAIIDPRLFVRLITIVKRLANFSRPAIGLKRSRTITKIFQVRITRNGRDGLG
jgi:hypothetical protein